MAEISHTPLARILGIDYGSKRIGLAVSDPLGIIATPLDTIPNDDFALDRIAAIVRAQAMTTIVVGMPLTLKGRKASSANDVDAFVERLKDSVRIEVILWDERFTSSIAQRTLIDMGMKRKDRQKKSTIDAMAAAITLQSFLNSTKHSRAC